MAMNPNVSDLCVYDLTIAMVPAEGVAADLSHINTKTRVKSYAFDVNDKAIEKAEECLTECNLVIVPAGVPRKPVNSIVPAMCELWKKKGLNPSKIVGVTTWDCVRAEKFVHEETEADLDDIEITVVGGHAGTTILPLFSQNEHSRKISAEKLEAMDKRVQDAGTEVVKAKNGKGSATLSMGYAGARLGNAVLAGLAGTPTTQCAYVASSITSLPYFASQVTFGVNGVETVHPLPELSEHEQKRLDGLLPTLKEEIEAGLEYASANEFAN